MQIRIGIVDDEAPALNRIVEVLGGFDNVLIAGLHSDPEAMLLDASAGKFDLAMLDMEMPDMHGLELGRHIYDIRPKVEIVFITAYQHYAHQAFDVEALDYIVKPVTKENIARALNRYISRRTASQSGQIMRTVIKCFGWFRVETEGGELVKFRNSKSRELLALLLAHQGSPVSKSKIIEALWPGRDLERAQVNLHSTVYQLRKDLESFGFTDLIDQDKGEGGSYRLKHPPIRDEWAQFVDLCRVYRQSNDIRYAKQAVQLYHEGYLKEHDWEWAVPAKLKAESDYQSMLEAIVGFELKRERYDEALPYLYSAVALNPYHEEFQGRIIAAHLLEGEAAAAEAHYGKLVRQFQEDLGAPPSFTFRQIAGDPAAFLSLASYITNRPG
jgi:two-component SAPR family response regulator